MYLDKRSANNGSLSRGAVAGIAIGIIFFILNFLTFIVLLWRRSRMKTDDRVLPSRSNFKDAQKSPKVLTHSDRRRHLPRGSDPPRPSPWLNRLNTFSTSRPPSKLPENVRYARNSISWAKELPKPPIRDESRRNICTQRTTVLNHPPMLHDPSAILQAEYAALRAAMCGPHLATSASESSLMAAVTSP